MILSWLRKTKELTTTTPLPLHQKKKAVLPKNMSHIFTGKRTPDADYCAGDELVHCCD